MTRPCIIESGRGRLIVNEMRDCASVTLEVGGAGHTLLLNPKQLIAAAAALMQCAKRIKQ